MSDAVFKDHFSTRAQGYAAFRPRYPDALFTWLASLTPHHDLAWDAGTGNGQAAGGLAAHFARVNATDASPQQIAHADRLANVTYAVGREVESGLPPASCDLITAAQALHWFNVPAFFAESRRVLKPDGAIAVWTYAQPAMDDPVTDAILQTHARLMDPCWPPERMMVNTGFRTIDFPFDEIAVPTFTLEMTVSREQLAGYLRTWSAHARYVEQRGEDPVVAVEQALADIWGGDAPRLLRWPLHVRAGRLPR